MKDNPMRQLVILGLVSFIHHALLLPHASATYCAFLDRNRPHEAYETILKPGANTAGLESVLYQAGKGQIQADNVTIKCFDDNHYCYSLWRTEGNDTLPIIIMQGCWEHADADECGKPSCISNRSDTKFCCCRGDFCNVNVTDSYVPSPPAYYDVIRTRVKPAVDFVADESYRIRTIVIALTSVFAAALTIALVFLVYRLCAVRASKTRPTSSSTPRATALLAVSAETTNCTPPSGYRSDDLILNTCLSRGRYGEIWTAAIDTESVVVKVLGQHHERHFINERDIYGLAFMDHPSLLRFYGSETRIVDNARQYWLVLEYLPMGALAGYLKNNVLDWTTLCKMCYTTASGLAHLHADITKGGLTKPVIAHRDVTSQNILVRSDLTCCLADFGLALAVKSGRIDDRDAEPNLTDVGTLRYMSPEVLDGAVNLRDCESSLKQIDVYALGLVMWEIATRCTDLYQGLRVPDHQLPFTAELGQSPTFDHMQLYVSRHKLRPSFPEVWKDSNHAIRSLKETIDECWDQDAEARLTAMCVQERCLEMAALWQVKYRSMLPLSQQDLADRAVLQRNPCSSPVTTTADMPTATVIDKNANLSTTPRPQTLTSSSLPGYQRLRATPSYSSEFSERSTDTVVSLLSPSVSDHNNLIHTTANTRYQGRNPIVERNTHKRSDEDVTVQGNAIVDSARPLYPSTKVTSIFLDSPPNSESNPSDLERSALVDNDDLNRYHHPQPPGIPYVQNRVDQTTPVMPAKLHNQPRKSDNKYRFSVNQLRSALNWFRIAKKPTVIIKPRKAPAVQTPDSELIDVEKCNLNNPRATRVHLTSNNQVVTTTTADSVDMNDCVDVTQLGVTRLTGVTQNGVTEPRLSRSAECSDESQRLLSQRPSSLSLDSNRSLKSGDDIKLRVKTPAYHDCSLHRQGRFSLYDDRMMDNTTRVDLVPRSAKTSISLQQFSSVADHGQKNNGHVTQRYC